MDNDDCGSSESTIDLTIPEASRNDRNQTDVNGRKNFRVSKVRKSTEPRPSNPSSSIPTRIGGPNLLTRQKKYKNSVDDVISNQTRNQHEDVIVIKEVVKTRPISSNSGDIRIVGEFEQPSKILNKEIQRSPDVTILSSRSTIRPPPPNEQFLRPFSDIGVMLFGGLVSNRKAENAKTISIPVSNEPPMTAAMIKCAVCQNLAGEGTQLVSTTKCGHIFVLSV